MRSYNMGREQVDVFNRDAAKNLGYVYTTSTQLSSRLATQRSIEAISHLGTFAGRSVLDVGCGDGFYTTRLCDIGHPRRVIGIDAAYKAIEVANSNKQERPIEYHVADAYRLPYEDNSLDLVVLQSILHHHDDPLGLIREAFRVAPEILIHEPNGNNFGLKIIEKTSCYHREHHEKSYTSYRLGRWIKEAGGHIVRRQFAGFVPMFCADWIALMTKGLEPIVEQIPLVNRLSCAVQVFVAVRDEETAIK